MPLNNRQFESLVNVGRLSDAISSYDRAIELNPNLTATWNNKGYALPDWGTKKGLGKSIIHKKFLV